MNDFENLCVKLNECNVIQSLDTKPFVAMRAEVMHQEDLPWKDRCVMLLHRTADMLAAQK